MDVPKIVANKESTTIEETAADQKPIADKKKITIGIRKLDRLETTTGREESQTAN